MHKGKHKKEVNIGKYVLLFFLIIYILPIFFSSKKVSNNDEKISVMQDTSLYDYGEYNTIKLLVNNTNEIKEMSLDEYIKGVVASEMPASYEEEALKAQAVVARTYTIYKIKNNGNLEEHKGANICNDSAHCQAWRTKEERFSKWGDDVNKDELWNKICSAVENTKGEIITYNGEPINAFFHANSGGTTESSSEVWGGDLPYLQAVQTSRRR